MAQNVVYFDKGPHADLLRGDSGKQLSLAVLKYCYIDDEEYD